VNDDCIKLTLYFGERDRSDDRFLADALLDVFGRRGLATSVLLRGAEGFGAKQLLRTQRLLTLSEDLPLVGVAVDTRERVAAALPEVTEMMGDGLVSLERATMLAGASTASWALGDPPHEAKLTVYCGRGQRANGRPAFVEIVELLRRHGVAGASVFLGVDGTVAGVRRRARFFGRNVDVPLMIISVGSGESIARAAAELGGLLERPLATLERVRVCKRDGERISEPVDLREEGAAVWQKLMVYTGEYAKANGRPLYVELIRRLRLAGAAGATALRGIWGYHGEHAPHGDRLLSLQRHVPMLTVVVDTPANSRRWFEIVDDVTRETGLVTSELVPAARATGPGVQLGTLRLA
jgi:PII-like signaling protein